MSTYMIDGTDLTNIADAIREQLGSTAKIGVTSMPGKIREISGGGNTSASIYYSCTFYKASGTAMTTYGNAQQGLYIEGTPSTIKLTHSGSYMVTIRPSSSWSSSTTCYRYYPKAVVQGRSSSTSSWTTLTSECSYYSNEITYTNDGSYSEFRVFVQAGVKNITTSSASESQYAIGGYTYGGDFSVETT